MAKEVNAPMSSREPTRIARVYWAMLTVVGVALTVSINAAHAKGALNTHGTWISAAIAAAPPLMFAALWEGFFLARRSVPQAVLRLVTAAVLILGGAAFAVSYVSIAQFINGDVLTLPRWAGWTLPAMFDTFVAVSAYVLHVLLKHEARRTTGKTRTAPSSRWRRLADAATARAEAVLATPASPQVQALAEVRGGSTEPVADPPTEPARLSVKNSVKYVVEARKSAAKPVAEPELEPFMDAAQRLVDEGVVARKTATELARVIAAIDRGLTDNGIKVSGIASASTAAKVRLACSSDVPHSKEPLVPSEAGRVLAAV
ncbi:hypothetical protein KC238_13270 [Mycobacteroides chelonae]|uniref:hypothetical protein n=1 Tax=Mycobacteroides chelonae TaxID=1774 RepID=UPI001C2B84DE|nr:hypothetical protein [Mycobacteroides chelonae]MBV0918221.1 hypothetical protein [Mycobacteroides chelonae]UJW66085.1 hypothetical protein H0I67_01175 [Mycobacteroides chelonae]